MRRFIHEPAVGAGENETCTGLCNMHALGHFAATQKVADAAVFLALDRAAIMTGSGMLGDGAIAAA